MKNSYKIVGIDKAIPIPAPRMRYPWNDMEVGDSFLIPDKSSNTNLGSVNNRFAPKHFVQRRTHAGVRIWRDK